MGKHAAHARRGPRSGDGKWVRRAVAVGAVALGAGLLAGVSGASSPSTKVNFTPLTPPYKVLNNAFVGANTTKTVVVVGGNTQVPTNATTLQLTVTAKGTKAGVLSFYPTGNPNGTSGQTIAWAANGTATGTIETDIGQKNSLNIVNTSAASATVTATITGYSTEVEAKDISGIGGTADQVLTNDGAGGATWRMPGRAYADYQASNIAVTFGGVIVSSLNVPAGSYVVNFEGTTNGSSATPDYARCWLFSPATLTIANAEAGVGAQVTRNGISMQGLLNTAGGSISVFCWSQGGQPMSMSFRSLIAERVGVVSGTVANARSTAAQGLPKR